MWKQFGMWLLRNVIADVVDELAKKQDAKTKGDPPGTGANSKRRT